MLLRGSAAASRGVALLAEGVDRNIDKIHRGLNNMASPSSRRAWIEIWLARRTKRVPEVALLAEGVDRNDIIRVNENYNVLVALLAEGVDRNLVSV